MTDLNKLKTNVYQRLRHWDKTRAQILKNHKKAIQSIQQFLDLRIEQCNIHTSSLQEMLQNRIKSLQLNCENSVMSADYVLQKNNSQTYQEHYDLLKQLITIEATQYQENTGKMDKLKILVKQLKGKQIQQQFEESNYKEQSSVELEMKNVQYLIDCQLEEAVENVMRLGETVSVIYNNKKQQKQDLYIAMLQFIRETHKQSAKHKEIGKQILKLFAHTMKNQLQTQQKIRNCLEGWNEVDGPIDPVFIQQLKKNEANPKIRQLYDLHDIVTVSFRQSTLQDFITNFKVESFSEHERLRIFEIEGFYNHQIESQIVITADCFVHLIRMNMVKPDFSFTLNPELLLKKNKNTEIIFTQMKKWMYFKKQKQFEFSFEFNTQEDFTQFKAVLQKVSSCKII